MPSISHKPIWILVALFFLVELAIQIFIIPQQMDEHGMFHLLACDNYRLHQLHIYREPCNKSYDVIFAGMIPWRYSAPYTGSLMDWLYRPLFALWPDPYSFFVFTLFFWGACVVLLSKLLCIPIGIAFLALGMNFAFVYHVLHGVSSVPPNIFMLLVPMLAIKAISSRYPWLYGVIAGLLMCLGIEAKMFFFYIIPGIAVLSVTCIWAWYPLNKQVIVKSLIFGVLAGFISACFAYVLINSPAAVNSMFTHGQRVMRYSSSYSINEMAQYCSQFVSNFWLYWGDLGNVMNRIYAPGISSWWSFKGTRFWTLIYWLVVICTCGGAIYLERKERSLVFKLERLVAGCILASFIMMIVVGMNKHSWTHHHHFHPVVPMFYAFAASLAALWKRNYAKKCIVPSIAVVLALSSTASVIIKSRQPLISKNMHNYNPSNEAIDYEKIVAWLRQPEIGNHVVIIQTGWGMYYTSSLYGAPNQLVMYVYGADDLRNAHKRSIFLGRPYVFTLKEPYYIKYIAEQFGEVHEITNYIMRDMPTKPGLRYVCEPPLPGLYNLCSKWLYSQAPAGWRVFSTVPYDELIKKREVQNAGQ